MFRPLILLLLALLTITGRSHAADPFEVTPLPDKRNLHGSVVVGEYLYVICGDEPMPKGFTNSVLRARINPDRTLGPWIADRPMPIKLIYIGNNVMVHRNIMYIAGGQEVEDIPGAANPGDEYNHSPNNTVIYAAIAPDGQIGPWQRTLPHAGETGQGSAAVTDGRTIYVMGGVTDKEGKPLAGVWRIPIMPDGTLGGWVRERDLPVTLWNHCAYAHNGALYTIGGRITADEKGITNKVFVSEIGQDGALGPWTESPSSLAYPVEVASACAADDFLFLFCGSSTGKGTVNRIQFSRLEWFGISEWKAIDTRMAARCFSSAALDRNRRSIYITGGRFSSSYTDINEKAYCFTLKPISAPVAVASSAQFLEYNNALAQARTSGRNILLLAYSNKIAFSRAELDKLAGSNQFIESSREVVLAEVDVDLNPSVAETLGVYRVPSYMLLAPDGRVIRSRPGVQKEPDVIGLLANP